MPALKIAAAQLNTTACDVAGNMAKVVAAWDAAEGRGAEMLVTQEQSLTGYPLEDTARNSDVLQAARDGLEVLTRKSKAMKSALIIGLPEADEAGNVYNVAYALYQGKRKRVAVKRFLPNNDVFDEKRIYTPGLDSKPYTFKGVKIGFMICEDTWHKQPAADLKSKGAQVLVSINASPFHIGKHQHRVDDVLRPRVKETGLPILYVNQAGGQDELVFDGRSTVMNADGGIAAMMPGFSEWLEVFSFDKSFAPGSVHPTGDELEESYQALVRGTRDYVRKVGYQGVLLGMSGGIDSALVAAIAADAMGPQNVHLFKLPSQYSSPDSRTDADDAAKMLGAPVEEIAIGPIYDAFMGQLKDQFNGSVFDVTEENLQARIRGTMLMALSNKKGWLLMSTGNKSEVSVGYCTLYGDMNGGFNPLKDVWKMKVYALAQWRNTHHRPEFLGRVGKVVPDNIISKKPTADLRPGQFDTDTLPPYPVLDEILRRYVERDESIAAIVAETGYDAALVEDVVGKVDKNEFKRRQACPGVRITECNFGKGRRVPVVRPPVPRMKNDLKPGV